MIVRACVRKKKSQLRRGGTCRTVSPASTRHLGRVEAGWRLAASARIFQRQHRKDSLASLKVFEFLLTNLETLLFLDF